jgi:GT2 family glycosyltransferase
VQWAKDAGADWLLQCDGDEGFQPTLLRQLMQTAQTHKAPIVFGLYSNVMKAPGDVEGGFYHVDMIFREVETGEYKNIAPPSDSRPFQVDAAGSGVLLTRLDVFDKISWPWFWLDLIHPEGKAKPQIMNEDISFCRAAREAGFPLWCDPLAEATHHKTISLPPSSFGRFVERALRVEKEMQKL